MINLSTGPIGVTSEVLNALAATPISHRSKEFQSLYQEFVEFICDNFQVKQLAILQGAGTLANDAMVWQIKLLGGKGLVLSNGEFGNRLIDQAERTELEYLTYEIPWGNHFDTGEIEKLLNENDFKWLLFAHCETSTGVVNDLGLYGSLAQKKNIKVFTDCMSTIGTQPMDLSKITMATCSSGKGLASIPGISLVLSNIEFFKGKIVPRYLDLHIYSVKKVPFTLSSNQLAALVVSSKQALKPALWEMSNLHSIKIYEAFNAFDVIPFSSTKSKVFTFVQNRYESADICHNLSTVGVELSCQSEYLLARNWFQLALFGSHTTKEIDYAITAIQKELGF